MYPFKALRLYGWSRHALRAARRNGLTVRYCGQQGYVEGDELIRHIREHGKTSR